MPRHSNHNPMAYTPGSIRKWGRLGSALTVVSIVLPEGALQWAALSLAMVAFVIAATRVPRDAWRAHTFLVGSLGCFVVAIFASALLDLSLNVTLWTVGVAAAVFVVAIVFSVVRLIQRQRGATKGI